MIFVIYFQDNSDRIHLNDLTIFEINHKVVKVTSADWDYFITDFNSFLFYRFNLINTYQK
jgi:hypothetical protein